MPAADPARYAPFVADRGRYVVEAGLHPLGTDFGNGRADQVVFQSITLTGFWLAKMLGGIDRAAVEALYGDLAARVRSGELHVPVEATYGIEEIAEAVRHTHREGRGGKILVTPNGPVS